MVLPLCHLRPDRVVLIWAQDSHTVTTLLNSGGAPYGTINYNSNQLNILGDASIGNLTTIKPGLGRMRFNVSTGTQLFTPTTGGVAHPAVFHAGAGELKLVTNNLTCSQFRQSARSLNFYNQNLTTTSNFTITNGSSTSITRLAARTITVGLTHRSRAR